MLRPPTAHCLDRLLAAVDWPDRDLDRALCDVGVLPPVDLGAIREALAEPGIRLTSRRNADGHSIVEIVHDRTPGALIHHDGRVQRLCRAAG